MGNGTFTTVLPDLFPFFVKIRRKMAIFNLSNSFEWNNSFAVRNEKI